MGDCGSACSASPFLPIRHAGDVEVDPGVRENQHQDFRGLEFPPAINWPWLLCKLGIFATISGSAVILYIKLVVMH
jgi:hypothetical protein